MTEFLLGGIFFCFAGSVDRAAVTCRRDVIFSNHELLLYLRNKQFKQLTQTNCTLKSRLTQFNALAYSLRFNDSHGHYYVDTFRNGT